MRNLTKTLAVISLLAPVSAQPLGIGDLKLHSALNQRLDAEINLLLSAGENPNDVQVRLAPPEKFDEAGIPWNYFLPQIKFEKVVQANGSVIVKLTSKETLEEPFLDFLVEVSWAEGNLYREFTVLVDPPAVYEQPVVVAVEKESEPAATSQAEEPKALPVTEPVQTETAEAIPASVPGSYGPTTRTDTLWSVAEQVRSSGDVSTEQMVMAIFDANPKAFYKKNVNALMSGKMLDIPDDEAVVKLSKHQAAKLFRQQNVHWNQPEIKAPVKEVTATEPVKKAEVKEPIKEKEAVKEIVAQDQEKTTEQPSTQLKLEAPVEAEVVEQAVVTPDQEQPSDIGEKVEIGKETLDVVSTKEETVGVKQSELDAMQARLLEMEQRLKDMQELLAMKDAELAALQNKRKAEQEALAQKAVPSEPVPETVKTPVQEKPAKTVPVEPVKPKTAPVKPKPKLKTVPVAAEEPETGFFDDAYYSVMGGLGALMLGGLGWLWWRKRKVEEETEAESMFASSSEIRLPDSEVAVTPVEDISTSYDVGTVGESSFLSEFTPSDFDAFDSEQNEVDPISEADVYLAYGRYQQAEELMRQAIADEPEREDCKLKLLEIFYANENKQAFEEYAGELAAAGLRDNHAFWTKVMEMGNEIIPDSAVLSTSGTETASFDIGQDDTGLEDVAEEPKVESADLDAESFDLESFDEPAGLAGKVTDLEKQEENEDSNLDIDFDLSLFEEPEVATKQEPSEESSDEASLDDDLDSIDFDLSSFAEPEKDQSGTSEIESSPEEDFESFDFDLSEETTQEESPEEVGELEMDLGLEKQNDDELESFDFSEVSVEPEDNSGEAAKDDELALGTEEEESFDFNFDFDEDDAQGVEGVSDLTDMDEFETKIDLARAYIDMGDNEAALGIAKEVLEKGNDQQKQAAQELLDQLA